MPALNAIILTNPVFYFTGWLYYALLESSRYKATLGKYILRLSVVDKNDKKISFGRATGRYFAKFFSSILFGIGFLMIGFTKSRQGLHDQAAGTFVIFK